MDKNPEVLETVESAMFIYVIDTLAPKVSHQDCVRYFSVIFVTSEYTCNMYV